jgi:thioredoxin-dependent peroxiredoxin
MLSWLWSDPLKVGTKAPDFALKDEGGHTVSLSGLQGKNVVLVFYPGDDTSVCTKQLCDFRDHWKEAGQKNTVVFGVNPWSAASHTKFRDKFHFPFPLLVDEGQQVAAMYHANGLFIKRTVYLIGPDGVIRFAQRGVPRPESVLASAG